MIHVKHLQRRWFFAHLDNIGVVLAVFSALWLRSNIPLPFFQGLLSLSDTPSAIFYLLLSKIATLSILYVFLQYVIGTYDLWASSSPVAWAQRLLLPNILLIAIAFSFLYLSQKFDFPRSIVITMGAFNFIFGLTWRLVYFRGVENQKSEIVFIGSALNCLKMATEFELEPFAGKVNVKALFSPNADEADLKGKYPIYPLKEFQEYSINNPYTSVIVVPSDLGYDNTFGEVLSAAKRGIPVFAMPTAYEILLGRLRHIQVNDLPLLELNLEPPSALFSAIKRFLDVLLASIGLILLAPFGLIVGLAIKFSSPGPIFYTQERVGFRGQLFKVLKFRSMIHNAEHHTGAVLAVKKDSRITKFGNFMRKTRIDELPQLLNILRGEMSFVGPRPERPIFVDKFEKNIPGYRERKRIRPGVTGLAQVSGTYESSPEIKLKYDLAYLANQSIVLDFQIMIRTAKSVLLRAGQ